MKRLLFCLALGGCGGTPGVLFTVGPLSVDVGFQLTSQCSSGSRTNEDVVDGTCRVLTAGDERVFVPVKIEGDVEPMSCNFELDGFGDCSPAKVPIFRAPFFSGAFEEEATELTISEAQVETNFDSDSDGFSNYREHFAGSNPLEASSVPTGGTP